jgi:hypothetical protein
MTSWITKTGGAGEQLVAEVTPGEGEAAVCCAATLPPSTEIGESGVSRLLVSYRGRPLMRCFPARTGAATALWSEGSGAVHGEERHWRDPLLRVYHLPDGSPRVLVRQSDGTLIVRDGGTLDRLYGLDTIDQEPNARYGGDRPFWPLTAETASPEGGMPLLIVLLDDRPLTRSEEMQEVKRPPARQPRIRVYSGSDGSVLQTLRSEMRHIYRLEVLLAPDSKVWVAWNYDVQVDVFDAATGTRAASIGDVGSKSPPIGMDCIARAVRVSRCASRSVTGGGVLMSALAMYSPAQDAAAPCVVIVDIEKKIRVHAVDATGTLLRTMEGFGHEAVDAVAYLGPSGARLVTAHAAGGEVNVSARELETKSAY